MKATPLEVAYEIVVEPGESLKLPDEVSVQFQEGTWVLTVRARAADESYRDHSSFLSGYSEDDEGLYDDVPAG